MPFKNDFVWGVAATAYQIEGASTEDGKGPCIWDMHCQRPGKIFKAQDGSVACDHYHRHKEDIQIMADMGVGAYELSINWARVLPEGTGGVNQKGVDFYNRVIDELLEKKIRPFVTIYHWEMPYDLYRRGGWLNDESPAWFGEYTTLLVDSYSDRVSDWLTLNEPQCFIGLGHLSGVHAPGDKLGIREVLKMAHNALLSHGTAVQVIRARGKTTARVGLAPVGAINVPATNNPADIAAAKKGTFAVRDKDFWNTAWWLDPIYLGRYPEEGLRLFGKDMPSFTPEDMKLIAERLDFFGVTLYNAPVVRSGDDGEAEVVPYPPGSPMSAFKWDITPEILYWGPKFFHERYGLPIIIAENGMSCHDWVSLDGKVHDPQRIDFIQRHLIELERACDDGVEVNGYFHWSIMDNFEWAEGYKERFGLVHIDFATLKRTMKDSAYYYRDVIASNGKIITT